jgi:hypothetical protein
MQARVAITSTDSGRFLVLSRVCINGHACDDSRDVTMILLISNTHLSVDQIIGYHAARVESHITVDIAWI